jgi:hypothetical protein
MLAAAIAPRYRSASGLRRRGNVALHGQRFPEAIRPHRWTSADVDVAHKKGAEPIRAV